MLATISSSLSAGIIDGIKNIFKLLGGLGNLLAGILGSVITYIYCIFYYLFCGIAWVMNFAELLFRKFAGIEPILTNDGESVDIITVFLQDSQVWTIFVSIVVLSIVLLMLFTFIAIIKSEFSLDLKGSAKGPIIARALKSLAMFIIVPAISVMGIYAMNAITQTVNSMLKSGDEVSMANQVWAFAVRDSNRARNDSSFRAYITGSKIKDAQLLDDTKNRNGGEFSDPNAVADQIDLAFKKEYEMKGSSWVNLSLADKVDTGLCLDTLLGLQPYNPTYFNPWNAGHVNYYYSLTSIDYLLGIGAGLYLALVLLMMAVSLIKRVIEIVILLLLAPPMISMAPLDGGSAQKKWQGEFIKRVVAIVGPVFAINMFFILVPVIQNITIFTGGLKYSGVTMSTGITSTLGVISIPLGATSSVVGVTFAVLAAYEAFFQIVVLCVGIQIVSSASALLSNLLGVEDIAKSGLDGAKKVAGAAVAMTGAGIAAGVAKGKMNKANKAAESSDKELADAKGKLASGEMSQEEYNAVAKKNEQAHLEAKEAKANHGGRKKAFKEAGFGLAKAALPPGVGEMVDTTRKAVDDIKDAHEGKGEGAKKRKEAEEKQDTDRLIALRKEDKVEQENTAGMALKGIHDDTSSNGDATAAYYTQQEQKRDDLGAAYTQAQQKTRNARTAVTEAEDELHRRTQAANDALAQHGAGSPEHLAAENAMREQETLVSQKKQALKTAKDEEKEAKKNFEAQKLVVESLAIDNDALFDLIRNKGPIANSDPNSHMYQHFAARGNAITQQQQAEHTRTENINKKIQDTLEQEEAEQIIEARRVDQAVESSIDRNALGDAVQQGIEESLSSLKGAMAEALRSGKLDVKGLTEIKSSIAKAQEAAMRAKNEGKGDDEVAQVLKDELQRIAETLKGGK